MTFKICFLHLCCISVALGYFTDKTSLNCTTVCNQETKDSSKYCRVECFRKNSQSISNSAFSNKSIQFNGYSGYAAVAAKLRFHKQQLDMKTEQHLESIETAKFWVGLERLCNILAVVIVIFIVSSATHTVLEDRNWFRVWISVFKYDNEDDDDDGMDDEDDDDDDMDEDDMDADDDDDMDADDDGDDDDDDDGDDDDDEIVLKDESISLKLKSP